MSNKQFLRVSVHSPQLEVTNTRYNTDQIIKHLDLVKKKDCDLSVFPELSICGYTCADLFYQSRLLEECISALNRIARSAPLKKTACIVGLPILHRNRAYNCAAFISRSRILGIIPKIHLPNTNEYYERRWFTSGRDLIPDTIMIAGQAVKFGTNLLFSPRSFPDLILGIEICEDLWSPIPPSSQMALEGANVICNLSASNEALGKSDYRKELVKNQSARCIAAYLYASASVFESSTDLAFSGHSMIYQNGTLLSESDRFELKGLFLISDLDIEKLNHDRSKNRCFTDHFSKTLYETISYESPPQKESKFDKNFYHPISKTPFVPQNKKERDKNCREISSIQAAGLIKRLSFIGSENNVIGVSGGIDSTLALLVTVKSYALLKWPSKNIRAVTMPGMGTTDHTKNNSRRLCQALGVTLKEIDIVPSIRQHLKDISHPQDVYDVTFENAQARERTQILMDMANQLQGIVIGTGDLSELALGWCTFNGDHMAMYHVNCGVPKSLVRYLIEWYAESEYSGEISEVLKDIYDTPASPELLPSDGETISQKTEELLGPYELHDFFLYYFIRHGFEPDKIKFLTLKAFGKKYSEKKMTQHLHTFYKRFFHNQFKRSAMPDGVKVGSVSLSPRGDWRMPSDSRPDLWQRF